MIDESLPSSWFLQRRGFKRSRAILLFTWLFFGNVLSLGYKSTLLSTLIAIRYEKTIETVQDLDNSGLPYLVPAKTAPHVLVMTDPRPAVKRIAKRVELYPFNGTVPTWGRKK